MLPGSFGIAAHGNGMAASPGRSENSRWLPRGQVRRRGAGGLLARSPGKKTAKIQPSAEGGPRKQNIQRGRALQGAQSPVIIRRTIDCVEERRLCRATTPAADVGNGSR